MAARGARAAAGDADCGISSPRIARTLRAHCRWVSAGLERHRICENVAIEYRWARGEYERLPALAAELVQLRARVIVAGGGEVGALAAKAATPTIPILINTSSDPVQNRSGCQLQPTGRQRHGVDDGYVCLGSKEVWPAVRDGPERSH